VDVFFYLFVGNEISVKGQRALQLADAVQLRQFTALAIESKFQMVENNFSCGQMSTGSFYKIARCAQMVEQHARQHAVHYTSLLLTRPDLRLLGPWSDSNERADERKIDSPAGQASSCAPLAI